MLDIKQIDFRQILKTILQNKMLFVYIVLPVTLIAFIYCMLTPKIYVADLVINPPKLTDSGSGVGNINIGIQQKSDADIFVAVVKSHTIAEMVVKKLDLVKIFKVQTVRQARDIVISIINGVIDPRTGFVDLQISNTDPKLASDIGNAIPTAVGQFISDLGFDKATQKKLFFASALQNAQQNLSDTESKLKDFNASHGIIASNQLQVITGLSTQLQSQLITAQMQLQALGHFETPENPDYKQLQSQIKSIKDRLSAISGTGFDDSIPVPANLAPDLAQKYIALMRDYTFRTEIYQILVRQYEYAKLDEASDVTPIVVQVIDNAEPPQFATKPRKKLIISASIFGSTLLCLIFIVYRNREKFVLSQV